MKKRGEINSIPCQYDFKVDLGESEIILERITADELMCLMHVFFKNGYEYVCARIHSGWE